MSIKIGTYEGLSKSIIYTTLTQIPTQILGIVTGVFITRILGPEGKGVYAIFYADIALFTTFLSFSINLGIIHFTANKEFKITKLLGISTVFTLITVILSILLLLIWLQFESINLLFPEEYLKAEYLIWFILFLLFTQINSVFSALFQGVKKFNVVNRVLLLNSIFNVVIFCIAFLLHQIEIFEIGLFEILILGLLIIVVNLLQWNHHFKKFFSYKIDLKLSWKKDIKRFFHFSGLGHLSIVINFLNYRLVLWIMAYYLDNEQIGIFALGAGLAQLLTFISTPLSQVLLPFMSSDTDIGRTKTFEIFSRIHFTALIIISTIALVVFVPLIPFVYGEEFTESKNVFRLILFGAIMSCQTKVLANYFISSNKIIYNLYATIIGFVVTFAFNIILVQSHGIYGASIAQSITYTSIFLAVFIALVKLTNWKSTNVFIINTSDIRIIKDKLANSRKK